MINTIKRNIKGRSLTHEEFDDNWAGVEDFINDRVPLQKYGIAISSYSIRGNQLKLFVAVTILVQIDGLPELKCWLVDDGIIMAVGNSEDLYIDNDFPIANNVTLVKKIEIEFTPSHVGRGAVGTIYLQDRQGHFSNPLAVPNYIIIQQAND